MTGEHSSRQYDSDLEIIRSSMLRMGGKVERQMQLALSVFRQGSRTIGEQVMADDAEINRIEIELDNACTQLIVRRQPIANDLRTVISTMKIITDLERIGDESVKMARYSIRLHSEETSNVLRDDIDAVAQSAVLALQMLNEALDAVARLDGAQAARIISLDRQLDDLFKSLMRRLGQRMNDEHDCIAAALDAMWVAKAIERIGDHAKNIAEYVIYIVEGRDVRHEASVGTPV